MEEKESTLQDTIDRNIETLWKKFQDIFVDCNGNLKTAWYAFPKGTNKNKVYDWLSDKFEFCQYGFRLIDDEGNIM